MLSENLQSADVVDYVVVSGTVVYIKIVKKSDAKNEGSHLQYANVGKGTYMVKWLHYQM